MRTLIFVAIAILLATLEGEAQTVVPVGQFRSIELRHGGDVVVRHGKAQRVTILSGNLQYSQVRVTGGQRLVVDNCNPDCPRNYRLRIEIITPEISAVSVSHGGTVRSLGAFPIQAAIEVDVEQGGTIDIRSIAADAVDASVDSGGKIFTQPRQTLTAAVESGGGITYWGDARVRQSVRDGGFVIRGAIADVDRPFSELGPSLAPIAPIPPVPPIPPRNH